VWPNMPGAYARTANPGADQRERIVISNCWRIMVSPKPVSDNPALVGGINVMGGKITNSSGRRRAHGLSWTPPKFLMAWAFRTVAKPYLFSQTTRFFG